MVFLIVLLSIFSYLFIGAIVGRTIRTGVEKKCAYASREHRACDHGSGQFVFTALWPLAAPIGAGIWISNNWVSKK